MHRFNWPITSKTATEVILRMIASGQQVYIGACLIETLPGCLYGSDSFGFGEIITAGNDRAAAKTALAWVDARQTVRAQHQQLLEVA